MNAFRFHVSATRCNSRLAGASDIFSNPELLVPVLVLNEAPSHEPLSPWVLRRFSSQARDPSLFESIRMHRVIEILPRAGRWLVIISSGMNKIEREFKVEGEAILWAAARCLEFSAEELVQTQH